MSQCPTNNNNKANSSITCATESNKKGRDDRHRFYTSAKRHQRLFSDSKNGSWEKPKNHFLPPPNSSYQQTNHSKKLERIAQGATFFGPDGTPKECSKKASLNHLLNFKYKSANKSDRWRPPPSVKMKHNYGHSNGFTKEQFLQANCTFVMSKDGDYSINAVDPDAYAPWEKVEQVCMWTEEEWLCPICLFSAIAAKITPCGHIYCWPCILHYLALNDKTSQRNCPICHASLQKNELRSVSIQCQRKLNAGDEVTMQLMCCSRSSVIPCAVGDTARNTTSAGGIKRAEKIIKHSPSEVLHFIIEPELQQLQRKLLEDNEELESVFLKAAIEECKKREADQIAALAQHLEEHGSDGMNSDDLFSSHVSDEDYVELAKEGSNHQHSPDLKKNAQDLRYFYQCEDGRQLYIHGINVKCLLREFGDFSQCPPIVSGKLVSIESFTMTEDLRKRHKYLSHLPLSCEYKIAELDLDYLMSVETVKEFQGCIQQRARYRQKKELEADKSRQRAEAMERRRMVSQSNTQRYSFIQNCMGNPVSQGTVSVLVPSANENVTTVFVGNGHSDFIDVKASGNSTEIKQCDGTIATKSFAQMLRCEKVKQEPRIKKDVPTTPAKGESRDSDDPDYVPPPNYQSSFGNAVTYALDALEVTDSMKDLKNPGMDKKPASRTSKKGKRKKQTLLFSTSTQLQHL